MHDLLIRLLYRLLWCLGVVVFRLGFGLEVRGREHLPSRGGVVLACNHVSYLDPAVVAVACPRRVVFLARQALFQVPWLGAWMRFMKTPSVDRRSTETGLRTAVRLLRQGQPVIIFPEGGRQLSGRLGTVRPGVGWLAAKAKAPVVPVLLTGTRHALPPGSPWLRPAKIRVAFGPPIRYPVGRFSSQAAERLAQQVRRGWQRLRDSQS